VAALDIHVAHGAPHTPLSIGGHRVYLMATMLGKQNLRMVEINECSGGFRTPVDRPERPPTPRRDGGYAPKRIGSSLNP
jgi:hypothetical protein